MEISRIAIDELPDEIPSFVRNGLADAAIGELGPEADESKTTGIITGISSTGSSLTTRTVHDAERDPGHFIDIDDTGVVIGGVVPLMNLPTTREAFDTEQRTGAPTQTQYSGGYLPYQILDGFREPPSCATKSSMPGPRALPSPSASRWSALLTSFPGRPW